MNDIIERIQHAKHVVVIAHINPDADSIGSASAVYTYLLTLHKKVSFFCATKNINQKLSFIPWFEKIKDSFPNSADLAISLDCGDINRLGVDLECDLINIDHHESNSRYGLHNLVDSSSISTTTIVYELFKKNDISINKKMATALYAGLLDDSDSFLSDDVDGMSFAVAKELINSGADYKSCNRFIKKYQSLAALRLKANMLLNMKLYNSAKIAVFLVTAEDMKKSGAVGQDCEIALEESLFLPTVEVALLLKENRDLSIKGSLRSSSDIDVSKIASQFGGGGHKSRAGFVVNQEQTLDGLEKKIIKLIGKEI
jgi:phosphoesterase RecJ-like protein